MNVVMIGPFGLRPKGTMAVRALPLARALRRRGHNVTLVLPPWSFVQDSGRSMDEDGVAVVNIALPRRVPGLWHLIVTWRLVRAAFAQNPDVIHCFKPKAYSGLAALLVWLAQRVRLTDVRLVVDTDDWEGYGGWNDIERYSRIQKAFFAWQERWGLRHADAVTAASRTLQSIVWSMGVAPARVFYVPNGVRREPAAGDDGNSPPPEHDAAATILLYTRFFEFGIDRAADIVIRLLQRHAQARLLIVGAGLFGEEEPFLARLRAAGLAERVTYAGWVEPADLAAHFATATVAIYPFDDTLINRAKCAVKLTDLLAAGVPVVADRVGQNAEYIEHGRSGLLIEPRDSAGFEAAVDSVLDDARLRREISAGARRRMAEQFTWSGLAARVEEAYKRS